MSIQLRKLILTLAALLFGVFCIDVIASLVGKRHPSLNFKVNLAASETGYTYHNFATHFSLANGSQFNIIESSGSANNIERLIKGEANFAIVQNDTAHYAYNGMKGLPKARSLRALSPVFKETIRLYTRQDGSVNNIADLRGKRICVGAIGSGTYYNAITVLSAIGLTVERKRLAGYM